MIEVISSGQARYHQRRHLQIQQRQAWGFALRHRDWTSRSEEQVYPSLPQTWPPFLREVVSSELNIVSKSQGFQL